jgi:Tfp pilus assembly PilM family ATPase
VNLKERLTSTENLLRSIRSGEAFASLRKPKDKKEPAPGAAPEAAPATAPEADAQPAPAPALAALPTPAPQAKKPFWTRQLSFSPVKKSAVLGVSMTSGRLSLAVVSGGTIQFSTRFPFGPDQAFGQMGFPAFLRTCLESVRDKAPQARVWAVLRSQDLDLNVLTVPKLSGAKLDAAVYWTQQKEKKFAEAEYAMDYVVLGPSEDVKEPRLDVLTCLARRVDVDRLRDAFSEAGWELEGITTLPSALQALYRLPDGPKGFTLAANIHVEEDASTIGLYAGGNLRFSRFIRSGTDSMAEALLTYFQDLAKPKAVAAAPETEPGDLEMAPLGEAKPPVEAEEDVLVPPDPLQAKGLMRHLLLGGPVPKGLGPGHILSPAKALEAIAPAVDRLTKQVERTLEYYATSKRLHCDVVHLSGRIFRNPGVVSALAGQLGYPHHAFDATVMLPSRPDAVSEIDRMALAPALAACLSSPDKGINLLRNYKQRAAEQYQQTLTRALLVGLAASFLIIGAVGYGIEQNASKLRAELAGTRQQLQAMGAAIDEGTLSRSLEQYAARQNSLRRAAERFTAPVILAELSRRTPAGVKILTLTIDLEVPPAVPAAPPPPGKPQAAHPGDLVTLEGIVVGDAAVLESTLSRFVIELEASPLFNLPVVHQTSLTDSGGEGKALHFVLHMGVK